MNVAFNTLQVTNVNVATIIRFQNAVSHLKSVGSCVIVPYISGISVVYGQQVNK